VETGHDIGAKARHLLLHNLQFLSDATIHIDPANASGERYHRIEDHQHDGSPVHSHQ
jgi:divalent metal cation (Fe/Co/Zn/Cd) transporter